MPTYDFSETRHRVVRATPAETWSALRALDFATVPSASMRVGLAVGRWLRKRSTRGGTLPARLTFDNLEEFGRIKLGEEAGSELVVGGIGKLGRWEPVLVPPHDFAAFQAKGLIKGVGSFSVRPYDEDRALLSYETRVQAPDEPTRGRLRRFWRLVGPFGARMMDAILSNVADAAERSRGAPHARAA